MISSILIPIWYSKPRIRCIVLSVRAASATNASSSSLLGIWAILFSNPQLPNDVFSRNAAPMWWKAPAKPDARDRIAACSRLAASNSSSILPFSIVCCSGLIRQRLTRVSNWLKINRVPHLEELVFKLGHYRQESFVYTYVRGFMSKTRNYHHFPAFLKPLGC